MTELPVQLLQEGATLPSRAYEGDAGLDLSACERVELGPGDRAAVGTGLSVAIPAGHAGFVQPRSGLAARHGIAVLNSPGLIDAGYRGEVKVVLLNTDRAEPFVVEPGMRIAQLVVVRVATTDPVEVDELPASERGEKGRASESRPSSAGKTVFSSAGTRSPGAASTGCCPAVGSTAERALSRRCAGSSRRRWGSAKN